MCLPGGPWLTLVSWEIDAGPMACSRRKSMPLARGGSSARRTVSANHPNAVVRSGLGQPVLFEPDPLALAVALEPESIQRAETQFVEIELAGQLARVNRR